ncbi:fumarylacetoacetate hydrolase family protein [Polyangium mundeleinium]|uniref:Fumarylacetoacetate hydrolase family protein n=1 Tax=Polyangium mundeleinium TaxID=2995306 RepID=A0ABT5EN65_9BACT|nr:fumarylacetoacetate hydrolase family protein [Polyangium mundeleinium]MDC0743282.1 fumarylacetoacetate hydrolase family protein [Polyangium mundeleinium]
MKLASLRGPGRDGTLIVVRRDGAVFTPAPSDIPTMQAALDRWDESEGRLRDLAARLDRGEIPGEPLDPTKLAPPLPRASEWVDGSAYINHIVLVRKARGAEPPETLRTDPLVYQGGSSVLLGPREDIVLHDARWGLDFEAEICVVLGDVPLGTKKEDAGRFVRLLCLANDITLRNLVPAELAKGFGFFQSKPATAFSPFAVTPDELGGAYRDGRIHLRLCSTYNGALIGDPEAGPEMHFSFFELVEHISKTRAFGAGTILGSGTVSNVDRARGVSCLAERRMIETIDLGAPKTPFMKPGDTIAIEMRGEDGQDIFGRIEQKVVSP